MNVGTGFVLPEWHDADGWMKIVNGMKAAFGADTITVEIDMPHGILTYVSTEDDEE